MVTRARFDFSGIELVDFRPEGVLDALRQPSGIAYANRVGKEKVFLAKKLAPVDTGFLISTIDYVVTFASKEPGNPFAGGAWEIIIFASAEYALYVELGTSRTPAQPYLRPALYSEIVGTGSAGLLGE